MTTDEEGLQIDIMVHRKDQVLLLIECKFSTKPVEMTIVLEFEKKCALLKASKHYTVEKVLICAGTTNSTLRRPHYFDRVLGLEAVF